MKGWKYERIKEWKYERMQGWKNEKIKVRMKVIKD